jgi:hypothetical protein
MSVKTLVTRVAQPPFQAIDFTFLGINLDTLKFVLRSAANDHLGDPTYDSES